MVQATTRRPVETLAEKWHRLARLAVEQGVTLLTETGSGERFAMSVSRPGEIHRLTPDGSGFACSCEGFLRWGRCKHAAALLAELGRLPHAEPAPSPVATCPVCAGRGIDPACRGHRVSAGYFVHCACFQCQGTGTATVDVVIAERPAA
ncbi:MAG: hypothetical protein M3Q71_13190 [Chloroflexota bacterium]|nr:hypothetical protein [Chloroflexota bacterium]